MSSPQHPTSLVLAAAGQPRQKAGKRRARPREFARSAAADEYKQELADLRRRHKFACESLKFETAQRRLLAQQHRNLAGSVEMLEKSIETMQMAVATLQVWVLQARLAPEAAPASTDPGSGQQCVVSPVLGSE